MIERKFCKAIKKNGDDCTSLAKSEYGDYCGRHAHLGVKKTTGLQSSNSHQVNELMPWQKYDSQAKYPMSTVLYYPWIDVQDEAWLKSALLYWDNIQTIVPQSIERPYNNRVSMELHSANVLQPIFVNPESNAVLEAGDETIKYFSSENALEMMLPMEDISQGYPIHMEKLPGRLLNDFLIHPDKMSYGMRDLMNRIVRASDIDDWYYADPKFAEIYMTILATRLSQQKGVGLVTPNIYANNLAQLARTDCSVTRLLPKSRERLRNYSGHERYPTRMAQGLLVDLTLEKLGIHPETPIEKILEFRENHRAELGRFRQKVLALSGAIPVDVPIEHTRQAASDIYNNEVLPAIEGLKESLKSSRIKSVVDSLMKVSFLSIGQSAILATAGLPLSMALLVGSGISLSATGILYNHEKKKNLIDNPYSYLLLAERQFRNR